MSRKTGLLIYQPEDLKRNRWFAESLCSYAEPEGISLRLCLCDEAIEAAKTADFAVNRSRDKKISSFCEDSLRMRVYNSARVTAITNDKWQTAQFLSANDIPIAKTERITQRGQFPQMPFPLVAKPLDGHGGAGVTWIANEAEYLQYAGDLPFLVQEPMQTGWDMRVYILRNRVYAAVLRTSETDFRSNFSLGGHAETVQPDREALRLVDSICRILPLDFAGIDLLRRPDGQYVIGEIEDAVGCRMLYQLTDRDPARDFIRMIAQEQHQSRGNHHAS